jgi:hypothetical protein
MRADTKLAFGSFFTGAGLTLIGYTNRPLGAMLIFIGTAFAVSFMRPHFSWLQVRSGLLDRVRGWGSVSLEEAARRAYEQFLPAKVGNLAYSAQSYAKCPDDVVEFCAGMLLYYVSPEGQSLGSGVWERLDTERLKKFDTKVENGKAVLRERYGGCRLYQNLGLKKSALVGAIRRMKDGLGPHDLGR